MRHNTTIRPAAVVIIFFLFSTLGLAQPTSWKFAYPIKIIHDSTGNVYVTAGAGVTDTIDGQRQSFGDIATIKYDPHGNQLWVALYNNPENLVDEPTDIAVDSIGNVYITGWSLYNNTPTPPNSGFITVKYDSSGRRVWERIYRDSIDVYSTSLAVDSFGNVYVTGYQGDPNISSSFITVKYDSNGNILWARTYSGPDNDSEISPDINIDSSGNIIICGPSFKGYYEIVKYDPFGNILLETSYITGYGGALLDSVLDAFDNIYTVCPGDSVSGAFIIKYDSAGNKLWDARHGAMKAFTLAVDSSGNVSVPTYDDAGKFLTVRCSPDGDLLWSATYDTGVTRAKTHAIGVDDLSNTYICGWAWDSQRRCTFITIKYDSSGNQIWIQEHNNPENIGGIVMTLSVDPLGNAYISGRTSSDGYNSNCITIKYSPSGQKEWEVTYPLPSVEEMTTDLIEHVKAINLKNEQGYIAKLDAALASYEKATLAETASATLEAAISSNQEAAERDFRNTINQLETFKNQCTNDPKLSTSDLSALLNEADAIIMFIKNNKL